MTTEQEDPREIQFRTRWTTATVAMALVAFWNVIAAAVFAAFTDWPALVLAVQSVALAGYAAWLCLEEV